MGEPTCIRPCGPARTIVRPAANWTKLIREAHLHPRRSLLLVGALAIGIFGLTAMLAAWAILSREIGRNYRQTEPASTTLFVKDADRALATEVRKLAGVADAQVRGVVTARVQVGSDWLPLLLNIVDDFDDVRMNRFFPETGKRIPGPGEVLLERSSRTLLGGTSTVRVKTAHGRPISIPVAGTVHDPGFAPSAQERAIFAYASIETLQLLGEEPVFDQIRVRFSVTELNPNAEASARAVAFWLAAHGHPVHEIRVPPGGRHPHQSQMRAVLAIFITFSAMALLLSAILVATVVAGVLAAQAREIAVMKALGGRPLQIAAPYLAFVLALGATALALGLPTGIWTGGILAHWISRFLNLELASLVVPARVLAIPTLAGLLTPLLCAALPIRQAIGTGIREAMDNHGVAQVDFGRRRLERWLGRIGSRFLLPATALRNLLRRQGRLALSLTLLASAGAMLMTSLNVREAWLRMIGRVYTERHYDAEILFNTPVPEEELRHALAAEPRLRALETFGWCPTSAAATDAAYVTHTYPDGNHGSFALVGLDPQTTMLGFPVRAGRWLRREDTDSVVLNHMAQASLPGVRIGDRIRLSVNERSTSWIVAGIVEEVGSPAAAYVVRAAFDSAASTSGRTRLLRFSTAARSPAERLEIVRIVEERLQSAGFSIARAAPLSELRTAMGAHIAMLLGTLAASAVLLGLIGTLGLTATLGMNILERTRELGVLKAIGASPHHIVRLVTYEGILTALLSWVLALPIMIGFSSLVGSVVGTIAFCIPLPVTVSHVALGLWPIVLIVLATLASALPAWRAVRLTVREALAFA